MGLSFWQIALVVLLFILLFGRGKISDLMGDIAKGIKSFKKGLSEEEIQQQDPKVLEQNSETVIDQKSGDQKSSDQKNWVEKDS